MTCQDLISRISSANSDTKVRTLLAQRTTIWPQPGVVHLLTIRAETGPSCAGLAKMVKGFDNDRAYALCTFAYSTPSASGSGEPEVRLFEGKTYGRIVPPRGPRLFGWDCCFEPEEGNGLT